MQGVSLDDILDLSTFGASGACAVSPAGDWIAFEVGRPVSESSTGTDAFGAQSEELDIYIAPMGRSGGARRILSGSSCSSTGQSYSPCWSPDGGYLAFVLLERAEPAGARSSIDSKHTAAIWSSRANRLVKLVEISPVSRHNAKGVFRWESESSIYVKHPERRRAQDFDTILAPVEAALERIREARNNLGVTATVHDSREVPECSIRGERDMKTSLLHLEDPARPVWSVDSHANHFAFELLPAPSKRRFVMPASSASDAVKISDNYFSAFRIGSTEPPIETIVTELGPYQASNFSVAWAGDSGSVWLKLVDPVDGFFCLGRIFADTGELAVYDECRFTLDRTREFSDELLERDGDVFFLAVPPGERSGGGLRLMRFDIARLEYGTVAAGEGAAPEQLFVSDTSTFIGCSNGELVRYDRARGDGSRETIEIGGGGSQAEPDAVFRVILPRPNFHNSRFTASTEGEPMHCLIRRDAGGESSHFLTTDGHDFLSVHLPASFRPMHTRGGREAPAIVGLETHEGGSDIVSISPGHSRTHARFNVHVDGKSHAEIAFFSAESGNDTIHSQMIFPVCRDRHVDYPTVVTVYPTAQFPPSPRRFAHDSGVPPFFNPHVYASNGCGVLNLGLPIDVERIEVDGVFSEYERIVDAGLAEAERLGYVETGRLFIQGHSWGGYAAVGIAARTKRFLGCIASAGIYNPIGLYGQFAARGESGDGFAEPVSCLLARVTVSSDAHPWDAPTRYVESSPLFQVGAMDVPTLLLHGEQDNCVSVSQAQQMYSALRVSNKRVRMITYGGEGHVISSRRNIEHAWECMLEFVAENARTSG